MLLTYEQMRQEAQSNATLLLGNGFCMAYDKDRFSFTSLLDSALKDNILKKESHIYKLFQKLNTADFESVMKLLDQSRQVVEVYEGDKTLLKELATDATNLKEYLVKIITNNHPAHMHEMPEEKKKACLEWLKPYPTIYTLNYDLLLYWTTLAAASQPYGDGFANTEESRHEGYVVYQNKGSFEVHYLHGAMHLFDDGDEIIKKTYSNSGVLLVTQVKEALENGTYPIFISEGDSSQKMTKILHSAYLNHCYKSLRSKGRVTGGGDIVIFGTTLKKNDQHIFDAILESNLTRIFIGVSDEKSVDHLQVQVRENNKKLKPHQQKSIILYDYRTTNPWQTV